MEKNKNLLYSMKYANKEIKFIIKLIIIYSIAYLYKKLLKEKFSILMDKIIYKINKIIN